MHFLHNILILQVDVFTNSHRNCTGILAELKESLNSSHLEFGLTNSSAKRKLSVSYLCYMTWIPATDITYSFLFYVKFDITIFHVSSIKFL